MVLSAKILKFLLVTLFLFSFTCRNPVVFADQDEPNLKILNPHEHPRAGEIWEINFVTSGQASLEITPYDSQTEIDTLFAYLKCGDAVVEVNNNNNKLSTTNWSCTDNAKIGFLINNAGDHTLAFKFEDTVQYAYNSLPYYWSKRLWGSLNDEGRGISSDSSNNIYVTGKVMQSTSFLSGLGYGDYDAFVTSLTYDRSIRWSKRLGGSYIDIGYDTATDSDGNVYIVGSLYDNADLNGDGDSNDGGAESNSGYLGQDGYLTSFDTSGNFRWAKRFGGAGSDIARSIYITPTDTVVVSGMVTGDADLNGNGNSTDGGGENGTGYGSSDNFISVFTNTGSFVWAKRLGGVGGDGDASVVVDDNNRVIFSGTFWGNADFNGDGDASDGGAESSTGFDLYDIGISVFDIEGNHIWGKRIGSTGHDWSYTVASDSDNNIYIGGQTYTDSDFSGDGDFLDPGESATGYDIYSSYLASYSSAGEFNWAKRVSGVSSDSDDKVYDIAVSSTDEIIVTGNAYGNADLDGDGDTSGQTGESATGYGQQDIFFSVFNQSGTYQWSRRLGGAYSDAGYSVTTDSLDRVLLAGDIDRTGDLSGDGDILDYDENVGSGNYDDIFVSSFSGDFIPPVVSNINPVSGSTITDSTPNITLTLDETGDCRASLTDESYADMSNDTDCSGDGTTSISCAITELGSDGIKNIHIACNDSSSNSHTNSTNSDLTYVLDTTAPVLSNFSPVEDSTITEQVFDVEFSLNENGTCRASTQDESYADMFDDFNCAGFGTQAISCEIHDVGPNGLVTLYFSCVDTYANAHSAGTNTEISYTLAETTPPQVSLLVPYPSSGEGATYINEVSMELIIDEPGDCRMSFTDEGYDDMGDNTSCSNDSDMEISCETEVLPPDGEVIIYFSCQDLSGNKNSSSNNYQGSYTLDTSPPDIISTDPEEDVTLYDGEYIELSLELNEAGECRIDTEDLGYLDMSEENCYTEDTTAYCEYEGSLGENGEKSIYISCMDDLDNYDTSDTNTEWGFLLQSPTRYRASDMFGNIDEFGEPIFNGYYGELDEVGMYTPSSIALDINHHRLFVADSGAGGTAHHRVLVFNLDEENGIEDRVADYVIGQEDFESADEDTNDHSLYLPRNVLYDNTNNLLYVSDSGNNRVLVFDGDNVSTGMSASYVLGQSNFESSDNDVSATTLSYPMGLALDNESNRLFVADMRNTRIVIYDIRPNGSEPITTCGVETTGIGNGMSASCVLGQEDLFSNEEEDTSQQSFYSPRDLAYDSTTGLLYMADSQANRVLVFDARPENSGTATFCGFDTTGISNGMNASCVLGQEDFESSGSETSNSNFSTPRGLWIDTTSKTLYVTDIQNYRILLFDMNEPENSPEAYAVIGQYYFETANWYEPEIDTLSTPNAVLFDPLLSRLYVSDAWNHRIMIFDFVSIDEQTLDSAETGAEYSYQIEASNYQGELSYELLTGELPDGLSLSSEGEISGEPTATGTFDFTVKVTDDNEMLGSFFNTGQLQLVVEEGEEDENDENDGQDEQDGNNSRVSFTKHSSDGNKYKSGTKAKIFSDDNSDIYYQWVKGWQKDYDRGDWKLYKNPTKNPSGKFTLYWKVNEIVYSKKIQTDGPKYIRDLTYNINWYKKEIKLLWDCNDEDKVHEVKIYRSLQGPNLELTDENLLGTNDPEIKTYVTGAENGWDNYFYRVAAFDEKGKKMHSASIFIPVK